MKPITTKSIRESVAIVRARTYARQHAHQWKTYLMLLDYELSFQLRGI